MKTIKKKRLLCAFVKKPDVKPAAKPFEPEKTPTAKKPSLLSVIGSNANDPFLADLILRDGVYLSESE